VSGWSGPGFPGDRRKLTLAGRAIAPKVSFPAPPRTHTGGHDLPVTNGRCRTVSCWNVGMPGIHRGWTSGGRFAPILGSRDIPAPEVVAYGFVSQWQPFRRRRSIDGDVLRHFLGPIPVSRLHDEEES
jgi:hypothetical protein